MNDQQAKRNFLQGTADAGQQLQCERLLSQSETVGNYQDTIDKEIGADPLIAALQSSPPADIDSQAILALSKKISELVAPPADSANQLVTLLDDPIEPDDLGSIDHYRVIEFMASGGMGIVLKAIDSHLQRPVCIKVLNPGHALNPDAKIRFEQEIQAVARLTSERVMPVLNFGKLRDLPYLVMPLLEGESLRDLLHRQKIISSEKAILIAKQMAQGLAAAHSQGLLHRDIKPDNVWVTHNGDIKLLDFGLARSIDTAQAPITTAGTVIGTPSYMAPEQITGKPLDGRCDLFALGVVLVEMMTGKSPFQRKNLFTTLMAVAGEEIDFQQIDPENRIPLPVREIASKLLCKEPDRRIASAAEMLQRLDQIESTAFQTLPLPKKQQGKRRWLALAAGMLGFLSCLGLLAFWNANDKGILVVETHDPQVGVKISDQRVLVHDPVNQRDYIIRIGETPLPSGVYQLETTDSAGDLVFSSQTIVIRRGEQTIVSVELKPPPAGLVSELPQADAKLEEKGTRVPGDASWADRSRDPTAQAKFEQVLPKIPAINVVGADGSGWPSVDGLLRTGTGGRLGDLSAWSIEARSPSSLLDAFPAEMELHHRWINSDHNLFAHYQFPESFVRLYDATGVEKHFLPITGKLSSLQFDRRFPGLLAVCVLPEDASLDDQAQSENPYRITIWRLQENYAEPIFECTASDDSLFWDRGYRLGYFKYQQLHFLRFDTGESFPVPAIKPQPKSQWSVTRCGRYLLSAHPIGGEVQTAVWNLQRGELEFAVSGTGVFNEQCSKLAAFEKTTTGYQVSIWDIESRAMEQQFPIPRLSVGRPPSSGQTTIQVFPPVAIEPNFERIAWMTNDGVLIVQDLSNNLRGATPLGALATNRPIRLDWHPDHGLQIVTKNEIARWQETESPVSGAIEVWQAAPNELNLTQNDRDPLEPYAISELSNVTDGSLRVGWDRRQMQESRDGRRGFARTRVSGLLSIKGNPVWLSFLGEDEPYGRISSFSLTFNNLTSPSEEYRIHLEDIDRSMRQETRQLSIVSQMSSETILDLEIYRYSFDWAWSIDSRFLLLAASLVEPPEDQSEKTRQSDLQRRKHDSRSKNYTLILFDLTKKDKTLIAIPEPAGSDSITIYPWQDGFLVVADKKQEQEIWLVDQHTLNVLQTDIFKEFGFVDRVQPIGERVMFRAFSDLEAAKQANSGWTQESKRDMLNDPSLRQTFTYYRGTIQNSHDLVDVEQVQHLELDSLQFSRDTNLILKSSLLAGGMPLDGDWKIEDAKRRLSIVDWTPVISDQLDWSTKEELVITEGDFARTVLHPDIPAVFWMRELKSSEDNIALPRGRFASLPVYEINFFDLETKQSQQTILNRVSSSSGRGLSGGAYPPVLPTDFGWLIGHKNLLLASNPTGDYLGKVQFSPYLQDGEPVAPRWILADGSLIEGTDTKGLLVVYHRDGKIFCQSLEQFQQNPANPTLPQRTSVRF